MSRKRKVLGAAVNPREVTKSPLTLISSPSCPGVFCFSVTPKARGLSPSDLPTTDPPSPKLLPNTTAATAPWSSGGRGLSHHQGRPHGPGFQRSAALSASASCPSNFQGHLPPKFLGRARFKAGPGAPRATERYPGPQTCPRPCSPTPGSASCRTRRPAPLPALLVGARPRRNRGRGQPAPCTAPCRPLGSGGSESRP